MTEARVVTWENGPSKLPGAGTVEEALSAPVWPVVPLREALETYYESDAHLSPVVVYVDGVPETAQPRLNLSALHEFEEQAGTKALVRAVFVDVDRVPHVPWASPEEARETLEGLLDLPELERAALYTTRAGWRAVFEIHPPIPLDLLPSVMGSPGDAGLLNWLSSALPERAGEVDASCRDRNRCYRAPRVVRDGVPTDPAFMDLDGLDAGPLDVSRWLEGAVPAKRRVAAAETDLVRPEPETLSAAAWAAAGLEGHLRRRYPGVGGLPGLGPAIRKHLPFFAASERNTATWNAVSLLLDLLYAKGHTPQSAADFAYRALAPCLREAYLKGVSSTDLEESLEELWSMVLRHSGTCISRRAEEEARRQTAEAARQTVARALADTAEEAETSSPPAAESAPFDAPLYPLVAWGSQWFVLDARDPQRPRYFPPSSNSTVVFPHLLRGCGSELAGEGEGPLGLELHDGNGKPRGLRDIYQQYGTMVTDVTVTHGRSRPHIDAERYRLERPGAVALDVPSEYSEEVDGWLRLLGGDEYEALLDWLATLTQLDRPTCALYLQGDPGAGKSFFAMLVASVFGAGFVDFTEATSRFNAGLVKSPVIFLDEKAVSRDRTDVTGMFRSLVANTEHRVEAKGQPVMTIKGACRVIIASNNADALPITGSHSQADIEAIATRIRWVGINRDAVRYMEALGRERTALWLGDENRPGSFARHVRWLELHRTVEKGARFLVEGRLRAYHELLALTSERLEVLNAITLALLRGRTSADAVAVGKEGEETGIHVYVTALRRHWGVLTKERNTPTQQEITRALGALAGVKGVRGRGAFRDKRVYFVPAKYLLLASDTLGHPRWQVEERLGATGQEITRDSDSNNN